MSRRFGSFFRKLMSSLEKEYEFMWCVGSCDVRIKEVIPLGLTPWPPGKVV
jgi:hypothetical protein